MAPLAIGNEQRYRLSMGDTIYSKKFFVERAEEVGIARIILKQVTDILRPTSIVDLGTGAGSWLAAAKQLEINNVRGLDGPWVPGELRQIAESEFLAVDLEKPLPDLGRFDMAICAEVLEHISEAASLKAVKWLCQSAPAILFSAAVPHQGGTNHVNEAWHSTWAHRFEVHGFKTYDIVRPMIWTDGRIPFWYRQNLLLMANDETGEKLRLGPANPDYLDFVHPDTYLDRSNRVVHLESKRLNSRLRALRRRLFG
jgi:hypothetical protein